MSRGGGLEPPPPALQNTRMARVPIPAPRPVGPEGGRIRRMFADVAPRYDFLNRTLSAGVDRLWRRRLVRRALAGLSGSPRKMRVLDLCCGTGDVAQAFARAGCRVAGADFCRPMLERARARCRGPVFVLGDAQGLPFEDASFDVVSCAFGIRNVEDPLRALAEARRVLRPGGRIHVLEFGLPRTPILGSLYRFYFQRILPRLGALFSPGGRLNGAYDYLPASVEAFPRGDAFNQLLARAGFVGACCEPLSFGIALLYTAERPEG